MFILVADTRYCVLHAADVATSYSETAIVESSSAETMRSTIERIWIYRHGAPKTFSSDVEFQSLTLRRFLE